jgi:hypothetical protein
MNNNQPGLVVPNLKPLLRLERCEKCKFKSAVPNSPNFECRRHPATVHLIPVSQSGNRMGFQAMSTWPTVQPDQWCGEWKPHVEGFN